MKRKFVFSVGVETYHDKTISPVTYAEADAQKIAEVLELHDFNKIDQRVLTNSNATKTLIESQLKALIKQLNKDDVFYFFYAGHGFSHNGENFITCHDTRKADLPGTSIKLQTLFNALKISKCRRVVMFLDACETGMTANPGMRGIFSTLNESELDDFFNAAEYHACFSACKTDEYSYPSADFGHGVWTYHILQALRGNAKLAVEQGGIISSASLQNYLSIEVPKWFRMNRTDGETQTPWLYGTASQEFKIGDITPILAQRNAARKVDKTLAKVVFSVKQRGLKLKNLPGFKRGVHFVPEVENETTNRFLGTLVEAEIKSDIDEYFSLLKSEFRYKRKEITTTSLGRTGTIITLDFTYSISASFDPADFSKYTLTREISNIHNAEIVNDSRFQAVFNGMFDTLKIEFSRNVTVASIVDSLETQDIFVDYDPECEECSFSIEGIPGVIVVSDSGLELHSRGLHNAATLVSNFKAMGLAFAKNNLSRLLT